MEFLTPKEAARILKISTETLKQWRRKGRLEGCYSKITAKTVRYFKDKIDALRLI